jgi:hypothetical protein
MIRGKSKGLTPYAPGSPDMDLTFIGIEPRNGS